MELVFICLNITRISVLRKRCNQDWFSNLMLKKKVASLDEEVKSDYVEASKKAVMDYILLDSEEKKRLDISVIKLVLNISLIL